MPQRVAQSPQGTGLMFGDDTEVCIDSEEVLQPFFLCEPPEQVRLFILLFCTSVAVGLLLHHRSASRFYQWFARADIPQARVRGLAYNACKAYGFIPVPCLSVEGFHAVALALLGTLLLSTFSGLAPRFFLFASFALYFLYFGQLFCESKHGGHGSLLMPSVFFFLALSGGPQSTPWSMVFIKIFVGVVYFAGAISKLVVAAFFGKAWAGSTMQAYLIDGMWSRPHPWSCARALQKFLVTRWWACTVLALSGLVFELTFLPLYLFGGHYGSGCAALIALSFHLGVDLLQGLDFKPFWCPIFWAFLPEIQAILFGRSPAPEESWSAVMARGFDEEPCRWILSAAYLAFQVVASLGMFDVTGRESLPMTCCPMFAVPRNMFGSELRAGMMTDADLRRGGHIDIAYNYSPFHREMPLTEELLRRLPQRVLFFMSSKHTHPLLDKFLDTAHRQQEFTLVANFEVSAELKCRIGRLVAMLEVAADDDWMDAAAVTEVIDIQDECRCLFAADVCRSRVGEQEVGGSAGEKGFSMSQALASLLFPTTNGCSAASLTACQG